MPGRAKALSLYRMMYTIRKVEDTLAESLVRGEIGCPVHLYSGEEAIATGVCASLGRKDWVFSSHRSHGHYLAKGGDVYQLFAEVYCRRDGCSKGRGGSMHLSSPDIGFPGSSAIVSGSIAVAAGAALAFSMQGEGRIVASFFGDGAVDEGVFYETLNLAALYDLPILFVCENNLYSTHMPIERCLASTDIAGKAVAMGLPAKRLDGNDVALVAKEAMRAVKRMRRGGGPSFLECLTYRHRGHVGPNFDLDKGLRPKEEFDLWMAREPIASFRRRILSQGTATEKELVALEDRSDLEVSSAHERARACACPDPDMGRDFENVFRRGAA
jgi:TPP-dependent pyruvate/acetoin dehydrogenase alpha subunit